MGPYFIKSWVPIGSLFLSLEVPISFGNSAVWDRWVFGAWGEASEDVHSLVNVLASSRQKHQHLLDGRRGGWSRISEAAELAMLTGQVRRSLSLEAVRSQARCLLSRLSGLGAGAAAAARRRAWAGNEERRMERERRAYNLSLGQGRCPLRRGQFLLA